MSKKEKVKAEKGYLATETDRVGEIATHYGFEIMNPPKISSSHISSAKPFKEHDYYVDAEEKIAILDWCLS